MGRAEVGHEGRRGGNGVRACVCGEKLEARLKKMVRVWR